MDHTITRQDQLIGALIGLARAVSGNEDLITDSTNQILLEALAATHTDTISNDSILSDLLHRVADEKRRIVPDCAICPNPCGRTENYDMQNLWSAPEDVRAQKLQILSDLCSIAQQLYPVEATHEDRQNVSFFLYRVLFRLGLDHWGMEQLIPLAAEVNQMQKKESSRSKRIPSHC